MTYRLCILFLFAGAGLAQAADADPKSASRYENVLHTQYAARTAPTAQRPEEAQQVYEAYLKSIGKPTKNKSESYADQTDTQPR